MKKKQIILGLSSAYLLMTAVACGPVEDEKFPWLVYPTEESKSTDSGLGATDITALAKEMAGGMSLILNPREHKYQYQRANTIDVYAGYWTVTQNKFLYGGALPTTYTFPNDYLGGNYGESQSLYPTIYNAYFHAEELGRRDLKAIAMLMYDYSAQSLTDTYGPIPFDDLRALKKLPPLTYISQKEVYERIFAEINEAVKILKETKPTAEQLAMVEGQKGGFSRGDWKVWVKFGNSLRLRMAMNMVKVEPEKARQLAEKSVQDEIGVFTDADGFDFAHYRDYCEWAGNNPLFSISVGWDDLRMGASLENILKRYQNPLIGKWFKKNLYAIKTNTGTPSGYNQNDDYIGVRQGVAMINKTNKQEGYGPFSEASPSFQDYPLPLFKRTEMLFIMAEGALRGWNMGADAKTLYERAIRQSFLENGLSTSDVDTYLEQTEPQDIDYVDPYNQVNNIKGRTKVGVKWEESDSQEVKLEKIITQMYMGIFPESMQAWTTFRRTGYPRLFPVYLNNWPGLDGELQIRRIPYIETPNNREEMASLPALLGGQPNVASTRLWWDVKTELRGEPGDDKAKTPRVIPVNF